MSRRPRQRRTTVAVAAVLAGALAVSGCNGGDPTTGSLSGPPTTAAEPPTGPRAGACYVLDVAAALKPTNTRQPLRCARRHTSVTVAVGTVNPVVDGHLLAIDSTRVQRQIADRCRRRVDAHVGGNIETQRLSRVQAVWFSPSLAEADHGALWYRCDLVISSGSRTFAALPRRTRGLLSRAGALNRYGTCGTAAPAAKGFERVICSAAHTWRARATITLPAGTRYLAKKAAATADSRCRDVEARRAVNILRLRWSFEWPTRAQWVAGQHYGLCWTPD